MGAQENKANSIKFYEGLAKRDAAGVLDCLDENITVTAPGCQKLLPWTVSFSGRDNILQWQMDMHKHITIDKVEVQDMVADGTKVVIFLHEWLTVQHNKFSFELDEIHIHSYNDEGKIIDISMCEDTAKVVAAVRGKEVEDL
ncbi:nuclear transport factor 2 family protein [Spirochaetota bacterium]